MLLNVENEKQWDLVDPGDSSIIELNSTANCPLFFLLCLCFHMTTVTSQVRVRKHEPPLERTLVDWATYHCFYYEKRQSTKRTGEERPGGER